MPRFVPNIGDVVWLTFDPQAGHEQAGRRPAFVLTPREYNERTGLMLACPVTSQIKGYPFEVPLPAGSRVEGVILADHIKSLDWKARRAEKIQTAPQSVTAEVLARLAPLLGI